MEKTYWTLLKMYKSAKAVGTVTKLRSLDPKMDD